MFEVQEHRIKILNTAFEIASPEAGKSQSIAFVGGPNSVNHHIFPSGSSHNHFTKATPLKPHSSRHLAMLADVWKYHHAALLWKRQ